MTDNRSLLNLTAEQKGDLQRWAQSRTLPAGDVFRARLILALADGLSYREIARGLKTVVLQLSNADKFVAERLSCVLRLPNRKGCR